MNHELAREVWQRLHSFEIDDPGSPYPFSARLAKENGWSRGFARRVIEEYKRYLLLCVAGDGVPCPSEHVDQAWHLHLTYTRSYWKTLCGELLGRPIHHEPTRGGPDEHRKHVQMYEQTLATYREFFDHEPPLDIWPPAKIRFGDDVEHQRVNVRRNWIVPKWILWPLTARRSAQVAACAGLVTLPLAALNPLDWHGPTFIVFYIVLYGLALVAGLVLRQTLRSTPVKDDFQELTPQEAACLAFNQPAAINAAICQMVQQGSLQLANDDTKVLGVTVSESPYLTVGRGLDAGASPLEQELFKEAHSKSKVSFHDLHQAGLPLARDIEQGLMERGLLERPEDTLLARWLPFVLMLLLLAMGLVKVGVGIWREKPVLFLVAGCVAAAVTAYYFVRPIRRTRAGESLLKLLRARHANLSAQGGMTPGVTEGLSPTMLAMAVGLFGAGVLVGSPLSGLQSMWIGHQQTYRGTGGCGGGCTSGSGCSAGAGCSSGCSSGCGGGGGCGGCSGS